MIDCIQKLRMGIGFCALLLFIVSNPANAPEAYGNPSIQSKPPALTSYEVLEIAKVVSAPETYNLRLVRFKGVGTGFRTTAPRGMVRSETHTFTLTDDTGAIEIFYTRNKGPFTLFDTTILVEGNPIDALVIITYIPPSGTGGGGLAGYLRRVERPKD